MNYHDTVNWLFNQLPMYQSKGKSAYKKNLSNTILLADYLKIEQEKNEIPPPPAPLLDASKSLKTSAMPSDARTINDTEELNVFYKRKEKQKKRLVL